MKKNLFYVAAFAMTALFAACSDSNEIEPQIPEQTPQVEWNQEGKGFIAFRVGMPIDNGTRANDNFDKGEFKEYSVKNVALMLFTGSSEADAKYQQWVTVTDVDFGDPANGNITLDKKYVTKIEGMDIEGKKVYALAIINHNKVFVADASLHIAGTEIPAGTPFTDIQELIIKTNLNANGTGTGENAALWSDDGGILMLNAPLCDKQGTTTNAIQTPTLNILQDVTSSIFKSENEAREGKCASIYVERAVAKVTVTHDAKTGVVKDKDDKVIFTWDLQAWRLDNTNTESYVVRNMSNFNATYAFHSWQNNIRRMVGGVSVKHSNPISAGDADAEDRYRTYFAFDPNYNTDGTFNVGASSLSFGSGTAQYCAENIFNVEHQVWGQTTRVLVSAKLTPGEGDSFYAHPGDDKYLSKETVMELAYNAAIKSYRTAIQAFRDKNLLTGSISYDPAHVTVTINNTKDEVTVVLPTTNIKVADDVIDADVEAANLDGITTRDQLVNALNGINTEKASQVIKHNDMGVRYYTGGTSYYQVRIKHFGDDLTPWNESEYEGTNAPSAGLLDNAYPNAGNRRNDNYLGRYGVLRNNWYEVNLSKVVKIGYPTLEDLKLDGSGSINPGTPDDHIEKEQWINAEVNILSWAKRIQNNNLGED